MPHRIGRRPSSPAKPAAPKTSATGARNSGRARKPVAVPVLGHGHADKLSTAATTRAVSDPVATRAAGVTTPPVPGSVSALIEAATKTLYLQLTHLDPATTTRLAAAEKRGLDVHVVLTPGKRLDQSEVQRVLLLTDSGVDLKVTTTAAGPDHSGIADAQAFQGKSDAAGKETAAELDSSAAHVKTKTAAFEKVLAPKLSTTGTGLLAPEKVKLHAMPDDGAGAILNAINSSKTSIDLEVYQLADRDVVDALKRAAHRGVKVRVMVEPRSLEPSNYPSLSKDLKAAGIDIQPTPPNYDTHGNVDHAKFLVVDKKELLFGTGNLVRVGLGGNQQAEANNRDFWVEDSRAQSLKEAGALFDADWNRTPTKGINFANLVVTPDDDQPDIFSVIDGAKHTLCVYNQSLSDKATLQKLLDAKARGVDVKVLLGAFQQFPSMPPANQPAVDKLKAAGISVQYLTNSYLHAKAVVTEDTAFVGSQNFTSGGMVKNREVGELFHDADVVKALSDTFAKDFASPGPQPTFNH